MNYFPFRPEYLYLGSAEAENLSVSCPLQISDVEIVCHSVAYSVASYVVCIGMGSPLTKLCACSHGLKVLATFVGY